MKSLAQDLGTNRKGWNSLGKEETVNDLTHIEFRLNFMILKYVQPKDLRTSTSRTAFAMTRPRFKIRTKKNIKKDWFPPS